MSRMSPSILMGISLCSLITVVSVILSALCFTMWGSPSLGMTFIYSAITGIGGIIFLAYKKSAQKKGERE